MTTAIGFNNSSNITNKKNKTKSPNKEKEEQKDTRNDDHSVDVELNEKLI